MGGKGKRFAGSGISTVFVFAHVADKIRLWDKAMVFRKTRSFGRKISLTDNQMEKLERRVLAAGLTCEIKNSWTGSAYVLIGLPE